MIRAVPRFSTHLSVSRSSDETLCVVIDELHLNVFADIGPSALKVWASSRPTFWRILFWEGNKIIHKMRWFFSSLLLTTILKLVFFFSEKRILEIYHFLPTAPPVDSKQNVPPLWRQKKKSTFFPLIICNVTLSSEKNVQNGCTQPQPSSLQNNRWCLYVLPPIPTKEMVPRHFT